MTSQEVLSEYGTFVWRVVLVRGILGILFGIVALAWPDITVWSLVIVFGVYAIADGIAGVSRAIANRETMSTWKWMLAMGIVSIAAGIGAFVWPAITALALLYLIAFHAIVFGVFCILGARQARAVPGSGWGWMLGAGIAAVVFGWLLIVFPGTGIISLIWLLGWYAIAFGVVMVVAALHFRRFTRDVSAGDPSLLPPSTPA
ncbi:HdeD family acid-resistance protein [Antrihabitans sp. YC2-6]|uniref:HdeD family acid-resistance protein n=1 Tax=Antrihabitans sp. YC2-6 TaxID=2799498 RepID=UPI0027DB4877|nr:HdeD family acid-resistance protein [Antrihabitans sp. YC2-6]